MDRKEKNRLKSEISKFIDLSNGCYKDDEVERLHSIVENRDSYNGKSRTYRDSYKTFDSEDTYRVETEDTYTFVSDDFGIHIDHDSTKDWDDGQHDVWHESYKTGRGILNALGRIFR